MKKIYKHVNGLILIPSVVKSQLFHGQTTVVNYKNMKYVIIIFLSCLTFSCTQIEKSQKEISQIESALRKLVEMYPEYKVDSCPFLEEYYKSDYTRIYKISENVCVQMQLLTPPRNDMNHDDILLLKDSLRCFAIPIFSNKHDNYWQFADSKSSSYNLKSTFEYEVQSMLDSIYVPDSTKRIIVSLFFQTMQVRPLALIDTNILKYWKWNTYTPPAQRMTGYDLAGKQTEELEDCELRCSKICSRIIESIKMRYSDHIDYNYLFLLVNDKIIEVTMKNTLPNTGKFEIEIITNRLDCRINPGPL